MGKVIAEKLLNEGFSIAVCARNQRKLSENLASWKKQFPGRQIISRATDLSKKEEVSAFGDLVLADFPGIDILVNNAGITRDGLFLRMKEEDWDAVINVNLKGTFNACKSVSRAMLKARKGKIINIGSVIGVMGNAGQANYAASKAGVIALAKSLAREFASRNITVNAVAPGYIKTAMTDKLTDDVKNKILESVPLGRMGLPSDVANVCLFLASKEADYVTGQTILVDGGMVTY